MTGEAVFEMQTKILHKLFYKSGYKFEEFVMPGREVQRWWTGNGESVILRYKDDRE